MKKSFECSCSACQSACRNTPGWFLPGQAEALAEALGISLEELFREKLAVDWWVGNEEDGIPTIFVLSPAIKGLPAGSEMPGNPHGECIFFSEEKCEIHQKGKPFECAALTHKSKAKRLLIARKWQKHQGQIEKLLGRKAEAKNFSLLDYIMSKL